MQQPAGRADGHTTSTGRRDDRAFGNPRSRCTEVAVADGPHGPAASPTLTMSSHDSKRQPGREGYEAVLSVAARLRGLWARGGGAQAASGTARDHVLPGWLLAVRPSPEPPLRVPRRGPQGGTASDTGPKHVGVADAQTAGGRARGPGRRPSARTGFRHRGCGGKLEGPPAFSTGGREPPCVQRGRLEERLCSPWMALQHRAKQTGQ